MKVLVILCIEFVLFVLIKTTDVQFCTAPCFDSLLLSRKKRYLVYPDGSSFAVKRSFSKAILDNIPRGIVLNVDCGVYYPLPGSKDPWNPSKLLYRLDLARTGGLSATPKPPKLKPKVDVEVNSIKNNIGVINLENRTPAMYFPAKYHFNGDRKTGWHGKDYFTDAMKPKWSQIRNNYSSSNNLNGPGYVRVQVNDSPLLFKKDEIAEIFPRSNNLIFMIKPSIAHFTPHYNLLSQRGNNITSAGPYYSTISKQFNRLSLPRNSSAMSYKNQKKTMRFQNAPWHNHREYRERREVYTHSERLGRIFEINMKACIMRAICEMNEELLPEGESLIMDIARILFDLPTDHDFDDSYGNIAKEKNVDCAKRFLFTCPYSPMKFLMRSVRINGIKDMKAIKSPIVYV